MNKTMSKKPKILNVVRTDAFVKILYETSKQTEQKTVPDAKDPGKSKIVKATSFETQEITAHEAPLPSFDEALQALGTVAAKILSVPPDYREGITVIKVGISYTEHGIRSATISFVKNLDATASLHPMKTPAFQIDDGKTPDQGRRQCTPKHAEMVADFIKEAQRYASGERSQQLLDFEEEGDADDGQSALPIGVDPS